MPHLDEGTIHAWLDGELSTEDAEIAARHVAECAECSALVAEARGMIAGAARIVSALDAGPIGVVPRARRAAKARRWPRLLLTPTGAALAATLLIAAVATLTVRRNRFETSPAPAGRMVDSPVPPAVTGAPIRSDESSKPSAPATRQKEKPQSPGIAAPVAKKQSGSTPNAPAPMIAGGSAVANAPAATPAPVLDDKRTTPMETRAVAEKDKERAMSSAQVVGGTARRDSTASRTELAKASLDSLSRGRVIDVDKAAGAGALRSGVLREVAVPASAASDATGLTALTLSGCYHLDIDSTNWHGVLPANFSLAAQFAAGGARIAAQAANSVQMSSAAKTEAAGYPVHAVATNGRIDSAVVGDWRPVGPQAANVRFTLANRGKPVTLVLSTASANAQIIANDRKDSVRVVRMVCPR